MELQDKIARYQEIERRGLLSQLPPEKQAIWAEIKNRGLVGGNVQQQPEQPQQDPYSGLDKAKYTLRAAGEGATFGLGDLVAGSTNVLANDLAQATNGQGLMGKIEGASNFGKHILVPFSQLWDPNLKKGRNEFVREQARFTEAHPGLNFTGELVGGLVTGIGGAGKKLAQTAGKQGIKALMKEGAREGTKFGALYGAGSGATQNEGYLSGKDALVGAGVGSVGGAALGAALPPAVYVVGKALAPVGRGIGKIVNFFKNKDFNAVEKVAGEDIAKSVQEGKPLVDFANEGTMDLALGTKQADPKAGQVYVDYARERLQGQRPKINQMLKDSFGEKSSSQLADELNADIQKGSKILYDKAIYQLDKEGNAVVDNLGRPVGKVLNDLEKVNKYEADYISRVYGTKGIEYEVQGLPQNDMRVLNYAKQLMDDDIQKLLNRGENAQARILAEKRAQFIGKLDKANPEYKQARAFFERGKQAEDALQMGRNFDKGRRENKLWEFNKLTDEQKKFYRLGMGDRIAEHTNVKTEGGNLPQRVFDAETNKRMKMFGVKDADKLINQAKNESITASNLSRLLQGSQTAEKQASVGRWATNPTRQAKGLVARTIDSIYGKIVNPNAERVAKMLTDPRYLAEKKLQAMQKDINLARRIGKYNFDLLRSGGIIGGEVTANSKSWQHLKKSPDFRTFEGIPNIRGIVENGKSIKDVPNYKKRADDFSSWNYYINDTETPQGNKLQVVTVGNRPNSKELYGFNPDFEEWVMKNPTKAQKIADTVGKPLTVRPDSTSNSIGTDSTYANSIVDILQNVKGKNLTKQDKKAIQEILKQAGYKGPIIFEQQERK